MEDPHIDPTYFNLTDEPSNKMPINNESKFENLRGWIEVWIFFAIMLAFCYVLPYVIMAGIIIGCIHAVCYIAVKLMWVVAGLGPIMCLFLAIRCKVKRKIKMLITNELTFFPVLLVFFGIVVPRSGSFGGTEENEVFTAIAIALILVPAYFFSCTCEGLRRGVVAVCIALAIIIFLYFTFMNDDYIALCNWLGVRALYIRE